MENIKQYDIPYHSLGISVSDVLELIGYGSKSVNTQVISEIENLMSYIPDFISAQCGYRHLKDFDLYITEDSFSLGGVNFHTDRIIASQLDGASHIAILVSTAGPLITWFSSELIKKGEFLRGYIADAFGSVVAERAADFAENEIKTLARSYGYNASNRLSPGYCGWDVSEQHKLFSFLPDNFCGVTLTESALMVPIKSTSAVIGIGENIKQGEYPCAECVRDDCFKRRNNAKDNR